VKRKKRKQKITAGAAEQAAAQQTKRGF